MSRFSEVFPDGGVPEDLNTFFGYRLPTKPPADENAAVIPGHLCWGKVGNLPSGELKVGDGFQVLDCDETHDEVSRETDDIRIENPVEPEDWVEVRRANKMVFNKTEILKRPPGNSSGGDADFGDFSPSSIELTAFRPLGSELQKKCKLTVTLKNGPTSA